MILGIVLYSCSSYKKELYRGNGTIEKAKVNAIIEFSSTYKTPNYYLKKNKGKIFNVFWVYNGEHIDKYIFSIFPESQGYISLGIEDNLGDVPISYFPNRYRIEKGNLFLWKDNTTPLNKEILSVMEEYGILDSIDIKVQLGLLPTNYEDTRMVVFDNRYKGGCHYYICKNNINIYKKVKTNIPFGYYKPPKLKCE
ncbi:hypothetical protein [Paenimyroides aestuarii]|uniref:Lipoprotein n=1 Tax=Paenimyroides aestuarii TaxID=2968490 RepID=A0ABY5NTA0_9FLAO|nr:hypothetical protein [Paenimyroides aestuarii]UUV21791.1 hypothetical protein NPX36_01695 [Paenimyroides aestuarii]